MTVKERTRAFLQRCAYIFAGTVLIAVAINMFFKPNNIVVGGFSGLGILTERLWGIKVSVLNIVLNIPLFFFAYKEMGKRYVASTVAATVLFSFLLEYINFLPEIKNDYLLAAVFGGIIDGAGIGLVLKGRGSTGGVDLVSVLIHKLNRSLPVSGIMFCINTAIVIAGMYVFGLNKGMYAVISVFISSKTINLVTSGFVLSKMAVIVSDKSDIIADEILKQMHRGVTFLRGQGAYTGSEKKVILCVFSQKEAVAVTDIAKNADPNSFIIITDASLVLGSGFKNLDNDDVF